MSQTLDFESDQFLQLLTEALRAGPGSPAWREAVGQLQQKTGGDADEMKLLLTAREHLESGKSYRQIRAGPGFTRKVMEAVEQAEKSPRRSLPMATFLAVFSIGGAVVAMGLMVIILFTSKRPHPPLLEELAALNFNRPTMSVPFTGGLPEGWKPIGSVAMKFDGGLSPAAAAGGGTGERVGGGLYIAEPVGANQTTEFEVTLRWPAEGQTIPQVFVSDQPDFSADRGTTPHEIAWTLNRPKESAPQVALPDGSLQGGGQAIAGARENYVVAIKLNPNFVIVSGDGKTLYSGPNLLAQKPRYLGIRFLCRPGEAPDGTAVVLARVVKAGQ